MKEPCLEENTPKQFGIEFKEISISSLISFESVKDYVDIAEQKYQSGEIYECLENCKIAFLELLRSYEANKSSRYSFNNILNIGNEISSNYRSLVGNHNRDSIWFEDVTKTTNKLRNILKITALGIDYRKYVFFEAITPYIQCLYLQPIITQYFIDNKSEIWLLFLIAHSKR